MTEEALKKVYAIYTDCWRFYKTHNEPVNTDTFWSATIADMKSIAVHHDNDPLCIDLLSATLSELERKALQKPN